jgi:hypothetical protein
VFAISKNIFTHDAAAPFVLIIHAVLSRRGGGCHPCRASWSSILAPPGGGIEKQNLVIRTFLFGVTLLYKHNKAAWLQHRSAAASSRHLGPLLELVPTAVDLVVVYE